MKKVCLLIFSLLSIGFYIHANDSESFNRFCEKYTHEDIHLHTLLVLKYNFLSIDDPVFSQLDIDREKIINFIEIENKKINQYNKGLEELFLSHYEYNFKVIDEKELRHYSSTDFPFLYKRYINFYINKEPSYARFFMNRKEKFLYKDIHVNHKGYDHLIAEKNILLELNKFLTK